MPVGRKVIKRAKMMNYGLKVLVAEDYATRRQILVNYLRRLGFTSIFEAPDGLAAWKILLRNEVGMVLTDWHMPRLGGLELFQKIRNHPRTTSLPVLMVTVDKSRDRLIAAVKAGVSNYIVKPFTGKILQEKIETIFSRSPAEGSRPDR